MAAATREEALRIVQDLCNSGWALAALTVAAERGLLDRLREGGTAGELAAAGLGPELAGAALDVLVALGLARREGERYSAAPGLAVVATGDLIADLRSTQGQLARLVADARDPGLGLEGWRADDEVTIEAQAEVSETATHMMARFKLPQLGDLIDRLGRRGASCLDVGAGGAGLGIALCRAFPALKVVGLEPAARALAVGRRRIAAAGLTDRIELHDRGIDGLEDEAQHDLAYVAQMFIPDEPLRRGLPLVVRALRPGGWLLTAAVSSDGEGVSAAAARLRNAVWGGGRRRPVELVALLEEAGFSEARAEPPTPGGMVPVLARAPA